MHRLSDLAFTEKFRFCDETCAECQGTTTPGLRDRFASRPHEQIDTYRSMYENCTIVLTNLELMHLYPAPGSDYDLSFVENIREVHGYVLIASNLVSRVPLTSLRIIRGRFLYQQLPPESDEPAESRSYALFVSNNFHSSVGLRSLEMPSLMGQCVLHIGLVMSVIGSALLFGRPVVNGHTARCTSPVSVVSQCQVASGRELKNGDQRGAEDLMARKGLYVPPCRGSIQTALHVLLICRSVCLSVCTLQRVVSCCIAPFLVRSTLLFFFSRLFIYLSTKRGAPSIRVTRRRQRPQPFFYQLGSLGGLKPFVYSIHAFHFIDLTLYRSFVIRNGGLNVCYFMCAEILNGDVMFRNNSLLCYGREDTIDWSYILSSRNEVVNTDTNATRCKSVLKTAGYIRLLL